jgi:hypothetical protein
VEAQGEVGGGEGGPGHRRGAAGWTQRAVGRARMRGKRTSEGGPARGTGPSMGQDGKRTVVQFPTVFMRREAVPGASPNPMRGKMARRKQLGRPRIAGNGYRGWGEGITGMRGTESEERERGFSG